MTEIVELLLHMFVCCSVFSFIVSIILFDTDYFRSLRLIFICGLIFVLLKFVTIQRECVRYICCLNNYYRNNSGRNGDIRQRNNNDDDDDDINNNIGHHQQPIQRHIKIASALILA